jgi:hypothetical protein
MQLANFKEDIGKGLGRQRSLKAQGSSNCFRLSAPEPGHLAEFCQAEANNSFFLTETFIMLNRVHEESVWEAS